MNAGEQANTVGEHGGFIDHYSLPEVKIVLFRSLFQGRNDVYARRFESRKTGKSGYQPACANQWVRGLCEKPKVKCAICPNRQFLTVTDEVVRWHLSGKDDDGQNFIMGVYPMLLDETCLFLVADFDKAHWRDDVEAVLETCSRMNVPVAFVGRCFLWGDAVTNGYCNASKQILNLLESSIILII